MRSPGVRGVLIEALTYLLLLFTPFAFGGVELWVVGVVQILSGVLLVAWYWPWGWRDTIRESRWIMQGIPVLLFVSLVALQLVPLPPSVIESLSPGAHELYSRAVPGYAEGRGFSSDEIPAWMLERAGESVPPPDPEADPSALGARLEEAGFTLETSAWRTLSIYPFATRRMLWLLLSLVAVYLVVKGHFTTRERLRRLVGVTVFSGFAVSFVGILQKLTSGGDEMRLLWIREVSAPEVFGPFTYRNHYAGFAVTLLPVALSMSMGALKQRRGGDRDATPRMLLWGFAAITVTTGVVYSLSRAGIISAVVAMIVVAVLVIHQNRRFAEMAVLLGLAAATVAFLVWIGPEPVVERIGTLSEGLGTSTFENRIGTWKRSIGMIADHPVVGSGLGTFRYGFIRYGPPGMTWWTAADNSFVELVCESGFVGGILFISAVLLFAGATARPSRLKHRSDRYLHAGVVSGLVALMLHSTTSSNLQVPAMALLAVVMAAILSNLAEPEPATRSDSSEGTGPS